jgi:hypothetical protein
VVCRDHRDDAYRRFSADLDRCGVGPRRSGYRERVGGEPGSGMALLNV